MAYTTINKSKDYFNPKLHSGNGSTQSITGVGFQPDFTWIKDRTGGNDHQIVDAVRGATYAISSNRNDNLTFTDGLTSFDSDGYSLGNNTRYNASGSNYTITAKNPKTGCELSLNQTLKVSRNNSC